MGFSQAMWHRHVNKALSYLTTIKFINHTLTIIIIIIIILVVTIIKTFSIIAITRILMGIEKGSSYRDFA